MATAAIPCTDADFAVCKETINLAADVGLEAFSLSLLDHFSLRLARV